MILRAYKFLSRYPITVSSVLMLGFIVALLVLFPPAEHNPKTDYTLTGRFGLVIEEQRKQTALLERIERHLAERGAGP